MERKGFHAHDAQGWALKMQIPLRQDGEPESAFRRRVGFEMAQRGMEIESCARVAWGEGWLLEAHAEDLRRMVEIGCSVRNRAAVLTGDLHNEMSFGEAGEALRRFGFRLVLDEPFDASILMGGGHEVYPRYHLWARAEEGLFMSLKSFVFSPRDVAVEDGLLYAQIEESADEDARMSLESWQSSDEPVLLCASLEEQGGQGSGCGIPWADALRFVADMRTVGALRPRWSADFGIPLHPLLNDYGLPVWDLLTEMQAQCGGAWEALHPLQQRLYQGAQRHGIDPLLFQAGRRICQLPEADRAILQGHPEYTLCLDAYQRGFSLGLREPLGTHPTPLERPS